MTTQAKQAKKIVKKKYPFATSGYNHRPGVSGAEVRVVKDGPPIVWGQRDEDSAWIAAAEKVENS